MPLTSVPDLLNSPAITQSLTPLPASKPQSKKVSLQALFRTFFLRRRSGKKIVPPLRGSDFLFSDFPHAYAWGSRGCAAPPALAPTPHETRKQNHHSAKNSPETFRRARIRVFNTHISPPRRMRIRLFDTRARQGSSRGQKKAFPRKNPTGTLHEAEAKTP